MNLKLTDGSDFHIRSAIPQDVPLILTLIIELAAFEKLSAEVVAKPEHLMRDLFGERKYAEVLIGERNSKPIAFALFFHNYSTFLAQPGLHLEDLFVQPAFRSLGIGKLMLTKLAQIAEERGCARLEWSVLDWNQDAIRFYQKLGAKPLADWTVFRLVGEALKRLAEPQSMR